MNDPVSATDTVEPLPTPTLVPATIVEKPAPAFLRLLDDIKPQ